MHEFITNAVGRIVIVDTLSICAGGVLPALKYHACLSDMLEHLVVKYPEKTSFIAVSKKQFNDKNDYVELSKRWPNVMIIICGKRPCIKSKHGKRRRKVRNVYELLAEADDHMVGLLTRAITIAGCAPHVMSFDKYRNSKDVMDNIPSYTYYVYINGVCTEHVMKSTETWLETMFPKLVGNTKKCTSMNMRPCSTCLKNIYPSCDICSVCMYCRIRFVLKGPKLCKRRKLSK